MVRQKAEQKGLGQYWPYIEQLVQLESGWNPSIPSQFNQRGTEDSWGLFQLNRMGGLGAGKSAQELKDPEMNAEIALNYIRNALEGGRSFFDALSPWVNARNKIFAGQGGGTMPSGQTTSAIWRQQAQEEWDAIKGKADESGMPISAVLDFYGLPPIGNEQAYVAYRSAQLQQEYTVGGEALEGPSPQEIAIKQTDLDLALAKAEADMQRFGIETAAQNFVNSLAQAQETRATAEYAQDYARNIAPPGMTTVPYTGPESALGQLQQQIGMTPSPAIPLSPAPAAGPYQALGQAQQAVPQAPELQFNAPALPGRVDLGQYSPYPQTGLPLTTGQDMSAYARMLAEAMRRVVGPDTALFGPMQLPHPQLGGR